MRPTPLRLLLATTGLALASLAGLAAPAHASFDPSQSSFLDPCESEGVRGENYSQSCLIMVEGDHICIDYQYRETHDAGTDSSYTYCGVDTGAGTGICSTLSGEENGVEENTMSCVVYMDQHGVCVIYQYSEYDGEVTRNECALPILCPTMRGLLAPYGGALPCV